jgi:hypothetical protein
MQKLSQRYKRQALDEVVAATKAADDAIVAGVGGLSVRLKQAREAYRRLFFALQSVSGSDAWPWCATARRTRVRESGMRTLAILRDMIAAEDDRRATCICPTCNPVKP